MYKHWLTCYGSLARRALWNVLISRIFRPRTWSPPWCVFATGCLDSARNDESFVAVRLPDFIIVDGGKGQLSAACRELQRLGLHDLPIIGLAKEREEIYRPGHGLPLRLPMDSPALRLLQRIRDEAHRFANAYHQLLMKKRVEESILDDCPGVSQN